MTKKLGGPKLRPGTLLNVKKVEGMLGYKATPPTSLRKK